MPPKFVSFFIINYNNSGRRANLEVSLERDVRCAQVLLTSGHRMEGPCKPERLPAVRQAACYYRKGIVLSTFSPDFEPDMACVTLSPLCKRL